MTGNDYRIITVENDESFVTIDTLVKFSGNTEKSVKQLFSDHKEDIKEFAFSNGERRNKNELNDK